jgi:hypothetical protein
VPPELIGEVSGGGGRERSGSEDEEALLRSLVAGGGAAGRGGSGSGSGSGGGGAVSEELHRRVFENEDGHVGQSEAFKRLLTRGRGGREGKGGGSDGGGEEEEDPLALRRAEAYRRRRDRALERLEREMAEHMEGLPSRDGADADSGSAAAANVTAGSGIPPSPGSGSGSGGTILSACSGCGDALSEEECRRATELGGPGRRRRRAPLCRICDAERFVERRPYWVPSEPQPPSQRQGRYRGRGERGSARVGGGVGSSSSGRGRGRGSIEGRARGRGRERNPASASAFAAPRGRDARETPPPPRGGERGPAQAWAEEKEKEVRAKKAPSLDPQKWRETFSGQAGAGVRRRIVTERASGSGPAAGARTGKRTDADAAGAGGEEPPPPEEAGATLPTPGEGVDDIEAAREHAKYLEGVVQRYEFQMARGQAEIERMRSQVRQLQDPPQRAASEQIAMGANGEISDAIEGENGWVQAEDPDTGEVFYWNEETGEMRYDKE